ncbi:MAG: ketoacyl-ACP synthase III [Anaerolineae bacterium]|nr:ketoacyl-ACP synthase III [Anaerolineae bacterium]
MAAAKRRTAPRPGEGEPIYAHIVGWGMAAPERVMTNQDLSAFIDTTDEWIVSRTGIRERHIASDKETTATLGLKAAQAALDIADILPTEIDLIICATSTPEYIFPSTASLIQAWLGASTSGAFDLSAACSGFVYGVDMATQAIKSGSIRTAVVIGTETFSRILDWTDRGTCILFGDGAGAVVLTASSVEGGVLSSVLRSDGSGGDLLGVPSVGSIDISSIPTLDESHKMGKMFMNGGEVFKFATRVIGESITQALDIAGLTIADLKAIVPHQANIRIIQAAARSLKVDESIFVCNMDRYANTSAASIPIALVEAVQQGRIKPGDNIAFVGFGGGLSWAAMVVKWGVPPPEERGRVLSRQRRQVLYRVAWWRVLLGRTLRQLNDVINRIRPERGRMERLRRNYDRSER